jgi:hypothetical protein
MRSFDRKFPARVIAPASLLFLSMFGAISASAADAPTPSETSASCREETRRVAVWQQGGSPKSNQSPRFEKRTVTVCNGKVMSPKPQKNASNQ